MHVDEVPVVFSPKIRNTVTDALDAILCERVVEPLNDDADLLAVVAEKCALVHRSRPALPYHHLLVELVRRLVKHLVVVQPQGRVWQGRPHFSGGSRRQRPVPASMLLPSEAAGIVIILSWIVRLLRCTIPQPPVHRGAYADHGGQR